MDWIRATLSNTNYPTSLPLTTTHAYVRPRSRSPSPSPSSPRSRPTSPYPPEFEPKASFAALSFVNVTLPSLGRHCLRKCIHFLAPSFLQPSPAPAPSPLPSNHPLRPAAGARKLSPTAYLDGLRGTAALFVFVYHFIYVYYPGLEHGYLFASTDTNPLQLPILRLFMSGPSMVSIFFVISGYVLSYKALSQIRRADHASLLVTLSSSTFRRAIRLFLPTLISIIFIALLVQCGAFTWQAQHARGKKEIPWRREPDPPFLEGLWPQLSNAFSEWGRLSNPFVWRVYSLTYDLHLWTIPVEFRGSIVVFVSLLGLARAKTWVRVVTLAGFAIACLVYLDRWDVSLFLAGAVLAELTLIRVERKAKKREEEEEEGEAAGVGEERDEEPPRWGNDLCMLPFLILGLYVASQPAHKPARTPGYRTLMAYIPATVAAKKRFWPMVGAVLIVMALTMSTGRILKRPFTTAFAQYLGRISYALYLVHGPVCRTVGYYTVVRLWEVTGRETTGGYFLGVLVGWLLVLVTTFWLSDIFWRVVDVGCVRFARWVENICTRKTDKLEEKTTAL
ncbi:hypothetical protein DRE_05260 [Drechslerella stenobrocha 248]|uniref:Acyltransferase 3 domain-containing protein n=1 Tax=Drechslerella stenobrocha 248 TaxID=1043628 RepID=W7HR99_9PEZI|nr:hypothetical protein DRE_05260 [Drechslerella stenobrocha 248]